MLRKYIRGNRGTAAIEFAFVLPVLLAFIFGSLEFGYVMWANSSLQYGATYGARYAFVHPTASASTIQDYALSLLALPTGAITYNVSGGGLFMDIDGSFTYTFLVLPLSPITLTAHEHQVLPLTS
jgi:Flp pilus assembly protein TadG